MRVERTTYETVKRMYTLEIDEDYIKMLNDDWDECQGDKPHPVITREMVIAVLYREPEIDATLNFPADRYETLGDWIAECINDDLWNSEDNEIIDGECHDYEDDVILESNEQETYDTYFDELYHSSPEGANDSE